jgi:hypothetical protein
MSTDTSTDTSTAAAGSGSTAEALVDGYLKVHRYLESTTAALASATAAVRPDDQAGAAALQRAWHRLAAAVEHHHRTHHEVVLAFVAASQPELSAHLAGLEARHQRLQGKARAVTTSLGWLVSGWRDRRAGTPEAVAATGTLARELREHLAEEECSVVAWLATLDDAAATALAERVERCNSGADGLPFALATGTMSLRDLPIGLRLAARTVLLPRYERDLAPLTSSPHGR